MLRGSTPTMINLDTAGSSDPDQLTVMGGRLYFTPDYDSSLEREVWVWDGTRAAVFDVNPRGESNPFELTAVVLSAAAGMRLGFSVIDTRGLSRGASVVRGAREALPMALFAVLLFVAAAVIEGFISPAPLPYWFKASVSLLSSALLLFYFVLLGYPRPQGENADGI